MALFLGTPANDGDGTDATLVDIVGAIGVNGDGGPWDYTDSYLCRLIGEGPNTTWTASEWLVPGIDALQDSNGDDTVETGLIQAATTPGAHTVCAAPVTGSR